MIGIESRPNKSHIGRIIQKLDPSATIKIEVGGQSVEVPNAQFVDSASLFSKGQQILTNDIERKIMLHQAKVFGGHFTGNKELLKFLSSLNPQNPQS